MIDADLVRLVLDLRYLAKGMLESDPHKLDEPYRTLLETCCQGVIRRLAGIEVWFTVVETPRMSELLRPSPFASLIPPGRGRIQPLHSA